MQDSVRFAFTAFGGTLGESGLRPLLPLTLTSREHSISVSGLLDTGAALNVLPYSMGLALGAVWSEQKTSVQLTGNLANYAAKGLIVIGEVDKFAPVKLAFAWTQTDSAPLLLGQVNFFMAFDVCFYRSQGVFDVHLSQ
jgi:hypothetical protein